jgi:hypothetical protein
MGLTMVCQCHSAHTVPEAEMVVTGPCHYSENLLLPGQSDMHINGTRHPHGASHEVILGKEASLYLNLVTERVDKEGRLRGSRSS